MGISDGLKTVLRGAKSVTEKGKNYLKTNVQNVTEKIFEGDFIKNGFAKFKKTFDSKLSSFESGMHERQKAFVEEMTKQHGNKGRVGAERFNKLFNGGYNLSKKAGKGTFNLGKFAVKKGIKTPIKNQDKFFGYELGLTPQATALIGAGIFGYSAFNTFGREYSRLKHGEIEGGEMPLSVNASFTPALQKKLDYAQASPKGATEFRETVLDRNSFARLGGVDPDIVFALHELRNQRK